MEAVLALLKYPWKWDLKQESDKSDDQSTEAQRTKQSALSSTSSDLVICSSQAVKDFLRDGASGKKREKEKKKNKNKKTTPANAGDMRDSGLIPGSGRSLEGGHGNPL